MAKIKDPEELIGMVTCRECGEIRMNTPSGSVCPKGCGKIQPAVPARAKRRYLHWQEIRHLPEAVPAFDFKSIFTISGEGGYFKRVARWDAGESKVSKKVRVGERVRFCVPYKSRRIEKAEQRAKEMASV